MVNMEKMILLMKLYYYKTKNRFRTILRGQIKKIKIKYEKIDSQKVNL